MTTARASGAFTYRSIRDALAAAGFAATQEHMGGNCAALVVTVHNTRDRYAAVVVGNGEWGMGESLDVPAVDGWLSVAAEDHGDWVDLPAWGDYFRECDSTASVVARVREAYAFLLGGE